MNSAARLLAALCVLCPLSPAVAIAHGTAQPQASADARALLFDQRGALAYSQQAIGRAAGDHAFVDREQRERRLSEFRGRPLVLSMIYTGCSHTCPVIIQNLYRAVERAQSTLGVEGFAVATVGFDSKADTPQRLKAYARSQGVDLPNWEFLSADPETIEKLSAEIGFLFMPSAAGFDHLSQVTILDAEGRVYRQIYGEDVSAQSVIEPLKELVYGRRADALTLSGLVNRIRLVCTVYDPNQGRYRFSYAIFIGLAIGFLSTASTAVVLVRAWLGHARG